ncbi:unnamed protein product, partial [Closterium sp. NIES-53]
QRDGREWAAMDAEIANLSLDDSAVYRDSEVPQHEAAAAAAAAAFDDDGVENLSNWLSRVVGEATTEQQQLDAIASCLFVANAMCDWSDSDAHRPKKKLGFDIYCKMPPVKTLLAAQRARRHTGVQHAHGSKEESNECDGTFFLLDDSKSTRGPNTPWNSFSGRTSYPPRPVKVAVPPAFKALLPANRWDRDGRLRTTLGTCHAGLKQAGHSPRKIEGVVDLSILAPLSSPTLIRPTQRSRPTHEVGACGYCCASVLASSSGCLLSLLLLSISSAGSLVNLPPYFPFLPSVTRPASHPL